MPRRPAAAKAQRSPDLATTAAAAVQRAADGAAEELAVLQAGVAARDSELERLQAILDDRQHVIDELGAHAAAYRRAADERAGLVAELDFQLQRLREDLARAERERNAAVPASDASELALDEERRRMRAALAQRDAEVRSALRDVETMRARAGVLETALAARAGLIEELQTICDERVAVIDRLSEEAEALRRVAEERRVLLETNEASYRALQTKFTAMADERERAVREITAEAERRSALLEQNEAKYRALEADLASAIQRADERERALHEVTAEAERRSALLAENEAKYRALEAQFASIAERPEPADETEWRNVAEERERALQEVSAEAERRSVLLAELTAALEGRTREVEDLRRRLTRAS